MLDECFSKPATIPRGTMLYSGNFLLIFPILWHWTGIPQTEYHPRGRRVNIKKMGSKRVKKSIDWGKTARTDRIRRRGNTIRSLEGSRKNPDFLPVMDHRYWLLSEKERRIYHLLSGFDNSHDGKRSFPDNTGWGSVIWRESAFWNMSVRNPCKSTPFKIRICSLTLNKILKKY